MIAELLVIPPQLEDGSIRQHFAIIGGAFLSNPRDIIAFVEHMNADLAQMAATGMDWETLATSEIYHARNQRPRGNPRGVPSFLEDMATILAQMEEMGTT